MGNCCPTEQPKSHIIEDPIQQKDSTQSSIFGISKIEQKEEVESYKTLPVFSQKLSVQLNMGFISLLNQREQRHHVPCYMVTSYHGLAYVPQSYFLEQDTQFSLQRLYFYPSEGSKLTQYPIKQVIILANILDESVKILKPVESSIVRQSSIIMIRFQSKININNNITIIESQRIPEAGQICCIKNKHQQEGVIVQISSIQYRIWKAYRYQSNIFAEQSNINNDMEQLYNSPNSKYISLTPLIKTKTLAPGPIFSQRPNKTYSFLGFYSGNSKQISQQKYFSIFSLSAQLSSTLHMKSLRSFVVELHPSNKPTIQTSINNFLSVESSSYTRFHPQFEDYQHYRVKDNMIVCGKMEKGTDLQLHKCLISKNSLPCLKGAKYCVKIKLLKHCSESNGLITIAFKEKKQFVKFDDKQNFFENRMYIWIIKGNNALETKIGVNNQSFKFEASEQTNFSIHQEDYITFYLDMKQHRLTCIIKRYAEDVFKGSQKIRAFSFQFPQQLRQKDLQLYLETNKGGEKIHILK